MQSMFRLRDAEIIAAGRTRDVYRHPDDAALLIKVIRSSAIEQRYGRGAPWYKFKRRRYRHLIAYLRDVGMGLVVEAVRAADGSSAPTVADLAGRGRLDATRLAPASRQAARSRSSGCAAFPGTPVLPWNLRALTADLPVRR